MKIVIPWWLKDESPTVAGFCELINDTLQICPNMSLAEFAEQIHKANVEDTYKRVQGAEKRQFGEDVYEN